ncbi:Nucleolysin TIAR [Orchesella cincta]|uniref:Nucleolysin TIAR n=1 Tax=Orchesella cincta TaxID=48709 RepID=A0A1D2NMX8_ORCCI|nr:Nucleolysin TIAR [Orchesella cincta]
MFPWVANLTMWNNGPDWIEMGRLIGKNEDPSGDPYAFIEFWEHHAAAAALAAMNKRSCFGKVSDDHNNIPL